MVTGTIVHLILAVGLFLLINWIGKHSHSLGYISLGLFIQRDEAPAFNLALRLLGPLFYVTIVAALLYSVNADAYVQKIWLVVVYYFGGRALFNVLMGRVLLVNWPREAVIFALSSWVSWVIYEGIIKHRKTILPDLTTATNELWVFIVVFVYAVLNKVDIGTRGAERRKENYLRMRFAEMMFKFGSALQKEVPDKLCESLAMTILLYESFNRPRFAQMIERVVLPAGTKTLGPMQVKTKVTLDDLESVRLGVAIVSESYKRHTAEISKQQEGKKPLAANQYHWLLVPKVAADYNRDDQYVSDIAELHDKVLDLFYVELLPEKMVFNSV
jgi:hypothetical protein